MRSLRGEPGRAGDGGRVRYVALPNWNTQRLQRAVDREAERTAPRFSIEALRPIGPVGHRHINFRGTYRFPIERYAERLVQSAA